MKKRIRFRLAEEIYSVEVERRGDEIVVEKDGRSYTVTLLPEEGQPAAPAASVPPGPAAPAGTAPGAAPFPSAPAAPAASPPAAGSPGEGLLAAPMAGVIKEVKVSQGQQVEQGESVLIMEAMKMDVDVQAPASGVVAELAVGPGDSVQAQQKLMRIQ